MSNNNISPGGRSVNMTLRALDKYPYTAFTKDYHDTGTLVALLDLCEWNPPGMDGFPWSPVVLPPKRQ